MNEVPTPRGWQARLDLDYAYRGNRTRLVNKQQTGPLTLQRSFYPEGDICHNYILHPPGGVVGGDSLHINVNAEPGAHSVLTTPGATKFYRSRAGCIGRQAQSISVAGDAVVEWLPQHNIFFPGADVALCTSIDVAPGGRYVGWEMHCFGLPSSGEAFSHGTVRSKTEVTVDGQLRLVEHLNSNANETINAATGLRGMSVHGSVIAAPCNDTQRDALERILQSQVGDAYPHAVGLTLVDEVLIVRATGDQTEAMQTLFTQLWTELRIQWLEQSPCLPRIWAT